MTVAGRAVRLTAIKYKLLHTLSLDARGATIYESPRRRVWGDRGGANPETVRNTLPKLRRKIGDDARNPRCILSERGLDSQPTQPGDVWLGQLLPPWAGRPGVQGGGQARHEAAAPVALSEARDEVQEVRALLGREAGETARGHPAVSGRPCPRARRLTVLEGIESFATDNPESPVARMREEMLQAIGPDTLAGDPDSVKRFCDLYNDASDIVFPATSAYLAVCHALHEYSTSHSLYSIELDILRAVDLEAHRNQVLVTFRNDLKCRLEQVSGIDDTTAYSQAFEIYGEVLAYLYLRERVPTERIPERKGQETPDFRCDPPDGKPFYVEVKSFDIVGGDARKRDMLHDGLDSKVELEEQICAGKSVAMAESEIAPFRKAGETKTYDPPAHSSA